MRARTVGLFTEPILEQQPCGRRIVQPLGSAVENSRGGLSADLRLHGRKPKCGQNTRQSSRTIKKDHQEELPNDSV